MGEFDKQIIIDGIDVHWCEHYTGNIGYLTDKNWTCRAKRQGTKCEDWSDCYFKRWQRKEQECEELKKQLKEMNEVIRTETTRCNLVNILKTELDQLKTENEELKKQLIQKSEVDMFFNTPIEGWSNDPCEICPHKAENEQLKEELSVIQHNCNREGCKYYDDDTFKVFYECKAQKALQLSANSVTTKYCDLLQILAEIKEVLQFYNNTTIGVDKGNGIFEFEVSNDNIGKLIYCYNTNPAKRALQKISECEVER